LTPKRDLIEAIRARGGRLTRQRQLVLEILEENQEHLDAETLYQYARKRDRRIGIATVYRTLAFLKAAGLVDERRFGEGHSLFEAAQDDRPHYHFNCVSCGQVIEFEAPQVMDTARKLCESRGLQVMEVHLHFCGYCEHCRPSGMGCEQI
jgi:Fur family ferric uptake transcriptional regulator